MKTEFVTFEELQADKRKARAEDARRLAAGEVTPEELQNENSFFPLGAEITIPDFAETLERYYGGH